VVIQHGCAVDELESIRQITSSVIPLGPATARPEKHRDES
jgi:hypothetical protein